MARNADGTKRRKRRRTFGKLPVSVSANNVEAWLRDGLPRHVENVLRLRREKGQRPDSCEGVW
jgi:hypothetical protein